ncbi:HNH endonuclease family protein [Streptomyces hainanensis]|uniref:HNH endonuclease n=1 Tax=Streptomyces hainanensis TaxID=402648 RepID=A0A4R4TNT7_9ACTN|nr:HNH endonuclease family protein [Streptomyces hainanensis]TDC77564.1 HNH endonuclease [Streptomyces hainanensis]
MHHPQLTSRTRRLTALLTALVAALLLTLATAGQAGALPPDIPDEAEARAELAALTVAPDHSMAGYSRAEFPHWITVNGCTTRQTVLIRDGENVEVTPGTCTPVAGTWFSPYDDTTWTKPSQLDIDHVVPLAEAWRSGADEWTRDVRRQFANDLTTSQLIAVSAASNRSKGDQDPADWQPPAAGFHCVYAEMWIHVKHVYELTLEQDEFDALGEMLNSC